MEGRKELVTAGPSTSRGWEGSNMPAGSCMDKLQHPSEQPRHKNGSLYLDLEFLSFEFLDQRLLGKGNQDAYKYPNPY